MRSARDVAQYILKDSGPTSAMKLQKLVYYSQAWSLVWDDNILFPEPIEAWENGPVVRDLWESTRGRFRIENVPGSFPNKLDKTQRKTVDRVIKFYGKKDAQWLSDLTHMERPWKEAWERGRNTEISLETMSEYYSTLAANGKKRS